MAKVSIVIPCYNVENYLKECLDSVINQTLNDIEIICINDGSTDSTGTMLNEYAEIDKRIKVIHKENGGYGSAMNVGLDNATGEYIGIVEPDDYITLNMYESLYNIAVKNDSDIVKSLFITNYQASKKNGFIEQNIKFEDIPQKTFTILEYPEILIWHPSIWSAIYKNDFLKRNEIKFKETPGAGWTDNPFFIQTMSLAKRIMISPNYYYYWRVVDNTSSEALKDYTLPFDRINEMIEWAEDNNQDDVILKYIYKKFIIYLNIVMGMKRQINIFTLLKRIKYTIGLFKPELLTDNKIFNKKELGIFKDLRTFPLMYIIKNKLQFVRKLFSLTNSFDNKHKIITILGFKIKIRKKTYV